MHLPDFSSATVSRFLATSFGTFAGSSCFRSLPRMLMAGSPIIFGAVMFLTCKFGPPKLAPWSNVQSCSGQASWGGEIAFDMGSSGLPAGKWCRCGVGVASWTPREGCWGSGGSFSPLIILFNSNHVPRLRLFILLCFKWVSSCWIQGSDWLPVRTLFGTTLCS